jgi:hypothetical protein
VAAKRVWPGVVSQMLGCTREACRVLLLGHWCSRHSRCVQAYARQPCAAAVQGLLYFGPALCLLIRPSTCKCMHECTSAVTAPCRTALGTKRYATV